MFKYIYLFRDHGQLLEDRRGVILSLAIVPLLMYPLLMVTIVWLRGV